MLILPVPLSRNLRAGDDGRKIGGDMDAIAVLIALAWMLVLALWARAVNK